ncbi:MAG: polysaccharide biosynthesis/export family protein, partial [Sphingobium sp.]
EPASSGAERVLTKVLRSIEKIFAILANLCLSLAMPSMAQSQTTQPTATTASVPAQPATAAAGKEGLSMSDGYVLGIGDVVQVSVLGQSEFDVRVQVQNDNTIQLPFINSITAADLTVLQLRDKIRKALLAGGYYSDPAVAVTVVTFASRYVTVLGAVGSPGIVPIDRSYRMSEIIARAGGSGTVGVDTVILTRTDGTQLRLSLDEIATSGPDKDPIVNAGDKVFVEPAKTFYIYGQISSPGSYPIERGLTLQKAIARVGGLTSLGSIKRVKVTRDGREIKKFGLSELIKDGDVIVVGERFF